MIWPAPSGFKLIGTRAASGILGVLHTSRGLSLLAGPLVGFACALLCALGAAAVAPAGTGRRTASGFPPS